MDVPDFGLLLLLFPIFLFALTIHEIAHALTANWGGDLTATYQNRLSLNPIVHIDPIGTILIPIFASISGVPMFGWARPVPVDEERFKDKAWNVVVSMAGPFSNILLVVFGALFAEFVYRIIAVGVFQGWWDFPYEFLRVFTAFVGYYILINWVLAFFNMLPVPPLDGSHVLYHFAIRGRAHLYPMWDTYRRFGILVLWIFFLSGLGEYLMLPPYLLFEWTFDRLTLSQPFAIAF
ncbi:MAG: site-2 protease family protein [Sumerlaeia bacterium]